MPRVQSVVTELAIPTRPFDARGKPEHSYLRGRMGAGPSDPMAGAGYDLPPDERGRSAIDLTVEAFERIVPGRADSLRADWPRARATVTYRDRPVTEWSLEDALATVRSPEGHQFIRDAFGYDSGFNPHNAGDAIQYLLGGNDPSTEARVPIDGMDQIPRALAARFAERGGTVALGKDVQRVALDGGDRAARVRRRGGGPSAPARPGGPGAGPRRAGRQPPRSWTARHGDALLGSVAGYQATKLYCWYERPWWRDGPGAPAGIRSTTDLANRMVFYFDDEPAAPAAMLAAFTDHRRASPSWPSPGGHPTAPLPRTPARRGHPQPPRDPSRRRCPGPNGSAFMHWGSDPREIAWTFWRAGVNSDEAMVSARQPDPDVPIHICGETFSRAQAWAEGALATAHTVADLLLEEPRATG